MIPTQKKPQENYKECYDHHSRKQQHFSSDEEEEEEGIINLCLIVHNDEVNIKNFFKFIFKKLFKAFPKLMNNFKKIRLKNKELKNLNLFLAEEKNKFLIKKEDLSKEMNSLVEQKKNLVRCKKCLVEEKKKLLKFKIISYKR